jgi:hypothetical protein
MIDHASLIRQTLPDFKIDCAFEDTLEKIAQGKP